MWILLLVLLVSCTGRTPAEYVSRQDCLDAAERRFDERGERECPTDWDACPARAAIMRDLETAQKECR